MGEQYDQITPTLQSFIKAQPLFFVATAPLSEHGHVSLSPKGHDTFRILSSNQVAYLDLTGSGNVFVNDIGGQFRIRIGASDSFECVTANQIWGPSDNEKGNHLTF